ncbi:hypothetical protein [Caproicibacter fermentans]|uniref:hypothetical protein n=1 Tax=Caproicibacter fermentans TaxID=2576756 RepID=UPI0012EEC350|nr:hypothetical protein [Caproicibacter fermentans]
MAGKRKVGKLRFEEIVPELDPEERARRIETFINVLATANKVPGYQGCRYYPDKGYGEVFISP